MSSTLGFSDNTLSDLRQNFYYYSNIQLEDEFVKKLNFSGFSEKENDFDFYFESCVPLIIKLDNELIEVSDIQKIKDLLSFRREFARVIKVNQSMYLPDVLAEENSDVTSTAGMLLEKVYQEVDDSFIFALFKLVDIKNEFDIVKISRDESHLFRVEEDYCFEDDENYYLLKTQTQEAHALVPAIALFVKIVKANNLKGLSNSIGVSDLINKLEFPVVILNDDHIVNYHNDNFAKLGITPNTLTLNTDTGWIDIKGQKYKILSSSVMHLNIICLIKQEFNYSKSHSELGIITSSIAHELNNPLAGILAAINMLELEDWSKEDQVILDEMKASANRCKSLINTFLGFSKVSDQSRRCNTFSNILQQATSLLSNRKIESGISIENKISDNLLEKEIRGASLPIILYLILSEMMTLKNHELLVGNSSSIIECAFSLLENDIILSVKSLNLDGQRGKILNRLIIHLLGIENAKVDIKGQDIIFYNLV